MAGSQTQDRLYRFAEALEERVRADGELVLAESRWPLNDEPQPEVPRSAYGGMTPAFVDLAKSLCSSELEWMSLYADLLMALARPGGEISERLRRIGDRLWMKSQIGEVWVWHTAFPPLDGGGSSQAGSFLEVLKRFAGRPAECCLEWCCGPGFLGFAALTRGFCRTLVLADINPHVSCGIERTIKENGLDGRVSHFISDNLKAVPDSLRFDLVLGNPPWAYREIEGLANPLIPNDPGWRIHEEFFATVGSRLTEDALLLVSCYEPFLQTAYIDEMAEPWDVRPRPPLEDFRRFQRAGGLELKRVVKPAADPRVELSRGMAFMLLGRKTTDAGPLELLGLGGEELPPEGSQSAEPPAPSTVSHLFQPDTLAAHRRFQAAEYVIRANLAEKPLRQVLTEMFDGNLPDYDLLEACGVPRKVVERFATATPLSALMASRSEYRLVEEHCLAPLRRVRVQLSQDAPVCIGLKMLLAWAHEFGGELETVVTVKPGARVESLSDMLSELLGERAAGISFWRQGNQTLFAQDSAKLLKAPDGTHALWVPTQGSSHRSGDRMQAGLLPLVQSSLAWEGGNVLCDGHRLLVGANSVAGNMRSLGLSEEQVVELFREETGIEPLVLGSVEMALHGMAVSGAGYAVPHIVDGGQADFHLDVDCCLLGPLGESGVPVALLADPEAGLDFLEEVLTQDSLFEGHFVPPQRARTMYWELLERSAERRVEILQGYARDLKAAGYQVVRIPDQRLVAEHNYLARKNFFFGYCNALVFRRNEQPTAALLPLGLKGMEARVESVFEGFGVDLRWLGDSETGQEMASMRGGLHCFCSKLG